MGEKIRKIRELKGFSQEYVGKRLGMTQQEYSRIESGKTEVSFERLQLIANIFEVDPMKIAEFETGSFLYNSNQKGGYAANTLHYHSTSQIELLEKINQLLSENIHLKEEVSRLKEEIKQYKEPKHD